MMIITLAHYLTVSGIIFGIGIAIALSKRNVIAVLMGVELMLNASNLVLLSFSRFGGLYNSEVAPVTGHVFVVFVLTVAAAEAAEAASAMAERKPSSSTIAEVAIVPNDRI